MGLVEYSDSDSEKEEVETQAAKRRKVSGSDAQALPPLPSSFLDQYSSTVRTSTKDDPSMHGGRKRVTPHVEGNWPTHVYLEWHPSSAEHGLLADIVSALYSGLKSGDNARKVTSLLNNDLDVAQPLHISLSRPLTLKTTQKDSFRARFRDAVVEGSVKSFGTKIKDLAWHPNESKTRWFLVLRLETSSPLSKLLDLCNGTAKQFSQPLLYSEPEKPAKGSAEHDQFHISIAWSLGAPEAHGNIEAKLSDSGSEANGIPYSLLSQLTALSLHFNEVKIRIGQTVHSIPLKARRQSTG